MVGIYRKKALHTTDRRVNLMNEILSGIRIIKYYCWEKPFLRKIDKVREEEMKELRRVFVLSEILCDGLDNIYSNLSPLFCLALFTPFTGKPLTAATAYTTLSYLILLQGPLVQIPTIYYRGVLSKYGYDDLIKDLIKDLNSNQQQINLLNYM